MSEAVDRHGEFRLEAQLAGAFFKWDGQQAIRQLLDGRRLR